MLGIVNQFLEPMVGGSDNKKSSSNLQGLKTWKIIDCRYQLKHHKLGFGNLAETYLAIENGTGQQLACKMISKKNFRARMNFHKNKPQIEQIFKTALKEEAQIWKKLCHPNIVKFKDFIETSNNIYFLLQFCSKGTLQTVLQQKGYFKQNEAIPIIYQIAKGIEYLFDNGIVHRDIKTSNILISKENMIKISDIGFERLIGQQEKKNNDMGRRVLGIPIYMSPQVIYEQPYTIKCDVWSCGVVFYRILFNCFPWEQKNICIFAQKIKGQITFPSNIDVSQWLKDMIRGMLTVSQTQRLNIKDVLEMIRRKNEILMDNE